MERISKKIEEIRRQPEHIKTRYVWGGVAISMFFILIIWFFSIAAMIRRNTPQNETGSFDNLKSELQNVNQQAPSLKDLNQQIMGFEEGIKNTESMDTAQEQIGAGEEDIQQSSAYSSDN